MTPLQRETLRASLVRGLGWQDDRVIWDGGPRPVLVAGVPGDLSRMGLLTLSIVSLVRVGEADERRATWSDDPIPVRSVAIHKQRVATLQFDLVSLVPSVEAYEAIERVWTVLQSEEFEAAHEASEVSLAALGDSRPAPFNSNGGAFSRQIGEASFNVAWTEGDTTAQAGYIEFASANLVRETE
jgi:hypothetical protein